MTDKQLRRVVEGFGGLSHQTRLEILFALDKCDPEPLSPSQLKEGFDESLGTIAHHTRELRLAGLIVPAGTKPARGAIQHFYRLSPRGKRFLAMAQQMVSAESKKKEA